MKYRKKDLQDIIKQGSLKRRLVLWFNQAHSMGDKPLLTDVEERVLLNSFKVNNEEGMAFNAWEKKRLAFANNEATLDHFRMNYKFHMVRMNGFVAMFTAYEQVRDILNDTLFILEKSPKRAKIIEHLQKKHLSLAKIVESKDKGFVDIKTVGGKLKGDSLRKLASDSGTTKVTSDTLLEDILYLEKIQATRTLRQFKSALKAQRDIMEEEKFKSSHHVDLHNEFEMEAREYQGFGWLANPDGVIDLLPKANKKVRKVLKKFDFYPDYEELEEHKGAYEYFWERYNHYINS